MNANLRGEVEGAFEYHEEGQSDSGWRCEGMDWAWFE